MPAYDLGMKTAEHFLALQADPEHRPSMINLPYALDEHGSTAAPLSTDWDINKQPVTNYQLLEKWFKIGGSTVVY